MKKLIMIFALVFAGTAIAAGETKEVCKDKKDKAGNVVKNQDGKPVQECKTVKVHKKLEGTRVPDQKK